MKKTDFWDGMWTVLVFVALALLYLVADLGRPS